VGFGWGQVGSRGDGSAGSSCGGGSHASHSRDPAKLKPPPPSFCEPCSPGAGAGAPAAGLFIVAPKREAAAGQRKTSY